ncbi:MAG: DUF1499 domain-containing protein, partial [Proteobacteria bacterium]
MATYLSFWGLIIGGLGFGLARYAFISPILALYTVVAGLFCLIVALLLGLVQWFRYGRSEVPYLSLVVGTMALGALSYIGVRAALSPVSDLSTDTKSPPAFLGPLYTVEAKGPNGEPDPAFLWPREYDESQGPKQRQKFPKVAPLIVQGAPDKIYPAVAQALKNLPPPWKLNFEDPAKFHLELTRENPYSHFIDDVIVELRSLSAREESTSSSTAIEFRSRARWAVRGGALLSDFTTDFGTGYRRILFLRSLAELAAKPVEAAEISARRTAPAAAASAVSAGEPVKQIPAASPNPIAAPLKTVPSPP